MIVNYARDLYLRAAVCYSSRRVIVLDVYVIFLLLMMNMYTSVFYFFKNNTRYIIQLREKSEKILKHLLYFSRAFFRTARAIYILGRV